jgi:hypothetical protein
MMIRFLKDCKAIQNRSRYCCEICGHVPDAPVMTHFDKDEEVDPDESWENRVDISPLKFGEDYTIIVYP